MQAEAAGLEPSVDMNPILLKPTSHIGSQVVVNGEVFGNWNAMDYYRNKAQFIPAVMDAFQRLAASYDVVVVEGAGSPAEINLRENDIVNMGLAKMIQAPVLLVGDIDRGGVFASLYGTVKLLEPGEQDMVKGLVINKFRGDVGLLEPGLRMIEEKTGIPVVGCIPMADIDMDDEDSLSARLCVRGRQENSAACVDIAVVRLPHISNFTDFAAFERMGGVNLYYVESAGNLGNPDCIMIPGTKNTMDDLAWLRESGLESEVLQSRAQGTPVVGICGGFQMLGRSLSDPGCVERGGSMRGMGLLDAETIFRGQKTRTRITGTWLRRPGVFGKVESRAVQGYEIHMGETRNLGTCIPLIMLEDGRVDALASPDGLVCGSYLHGLFDTDGLAEAFAAQLAWGKGVEFPRKKFDLQAYKEAQYDKLADLIRDSLDMPAVYGILGVSGSGIEKDR